MTVNVTLLNWTELCLSWSVVLASVGTMSMAILEMFKGVSRVRYRYHQWMIGRWVKNAAHHDAALTHLLELTAGDPDDAAVFYDQPSEKVFGQLQDAARIVLDSPQKYPEVFHFLVGPLLRKDADDWTLYRQKPMQGMSPEDLANANQAFTWLQHAVTRRIQILQTRNDYWWARLNQFVAVGIAAFILWVCLPNQAPVGLSLPKLESSPGVWKVYRGLLSLVGGILAPFSKDIVNALTQARTDLLPR